MSCGIGHRRGSDPALLWPWRRLVATAPIGPLATKPPYAAGTALKKTERQKKKKNLGLSQSEELNSSPLCYGLKYFLLPINLQHRPPFVKNKDIKVTQCCILNISSVR